MPLKDITGHVVAITGASSGIGEATALAAARAGAAVALGARRVDRIEALAERINGEGGRAIAVAVDVTDPQQAHAFIDETRAQLGRLDVLVNNAGMMLLGSIEGADQDGWRRMIEVNLLGVLYATHAALPHMRAAGSGHIVNLSSLAGRVPSAGYGVYSLTKAGVAAFSESLRQETLDGNIRVTIVEPGATDTELLSHNTDAVQQQTNDSLDGVALLQSEDIADAIVNALQQPSHVSINEVLVRPSLLGA